MRRALFHASMRYSPGEPADFLVYLSIVELSEVGARYGAEAETELAAVIGRLIWQCATPLFVGYEGKGRLCFVLPGACDAQRQLQDLAQRLGDSELRTGFELPRLTPAIGYTSLGATETLDSRIRHGLAALHEAQVRGDRVPVRFADPRRALGASAGPATWLAGGYRQLRTPLQIGATTLLGFVLPFCILNALYGTGVDMSPALYLCTVLGLLFTSYMIWYEGLQAIRGAQPPEEPAAPYPPASALIAAYLPNEAATIVATVEAALRIDYPGPLEVVLAYNTPVDLPVEDELRALAVRDPRLRLLRVAGSTSKAQNINAALAGLRGEFVGIFDADHHPARDSFARAWRWLAQGYDVVQGHCVIRNGDTNWVTRLVAVEFETIYAVAHPGRCKVHGFGIFGGSNGYWKTDLLRRTRMDPTMLTEDIDASMRALLSGASIASDPLLLSDELAPLTLKALWNQRMRWAQGWFQVSLRHTWPALRSSTLSLRQKLGVAHLLVWRELYPWCSIQIMTVLAFWLWNGGLTNVNLLIPIFVLTTLLTFSSGPGQVLFAYLLGAPALRRRGHWYLLYLVAAPLFYSGFKNLISRVAMVKEALQERQWKVTPRAVSPELSRPGVER